MKGKVLFFSFIVFLQFTIKQITVYAITGQIVYSFMPKSQISEINLKDYPSGIYIIKVTDETGIVLQKKIIKK